ncbi:bifunctional UDP-N-acetylglucosamine diphosphorylase/glucosamine-1-phosphate N-acetyltransferase GlmU [Campylobacter sp. VBCF_02 NA5]|uniref:bifunctional UDP-N-acetylglucosamine diphosphorylase/glucosamine-1-phosphate N-acetyltransferase GlmU n=1 Tax=unclassified Campylobacter TaxID=2593542 RepID=UPI0022E9C51C|nr:MULTISPECIES: bifunctional UDP-N-acetylglucosamine diphosphorylase/glucosamine-1-phosphate N-acetyltransferase GlmU [unclassified Campylobacter]MDA3053848.1 bifunctional UDP-N-acetylglucosamine diphosphorylase/glucosamine-1-phosphate N-acetyltransferase GlmU [Campylobacter sp. VBCF_07 NA4]MDA3060263.1 bifunctional UDP-N-acetylglucosamine diphosphorylase/glucosamine-1-phosphate N-acetyltransferase GlmU [Campylobacter sp. VBCF_02 NA5]WBR54893.1 bifunctional UDP-N-acetylglucosamine diphosphoryla
MSEISVVILAAGFGTRMKSDRPKVLFELCGKSMLSHVLERAYEISDDVSVILHYQFDRVKEAVLSEYPSTKIYKQDHENFPGTAGALKDIKFDSQKTLIVCGDMPLIDSADLRSLCSSDADVALSVFRAKDPFGYGRVITKNGEILKIVEQKDASEEEKLVCDANAGCYCFDTKVLEKILPQITPNNAQKEYYLTDSIKIAKDMGLKCSAVWVDEQNFMGINDKFALSVAEEIMQNRIKERLMKAGVLMRLPSTIYIDCRAKFIGECELQENVSIIGECVIENSIIKSSSVVESSLIKNSDLGPMAHIRPKCEIVSTHIGNFVELKNAKVNNIKAGHLSYLGDCEISSGTNIGCGTITCNYDGKKKYKTIIGKNVFVGSDTQFVAPVKIGDDVIIAAGSTIVSDVPNGALAIARSKQTNKAEFFYKFFRSNNE